MSHFTTRAAQEEFMKKFADPVQEMLGTQGAIPDASAAYVKIGQCWGDAERAITALTGDDAHVPHEGETLETSIADAVTAQLAHLFQLCKPQVTPPGKDKHTLGLRITSIRKAHSIAMRGAAAYAAAAADRAAAVQFAGVPDIHPLSPGPPTEPAESEPVRAQVETGEEADLLDLLVDRIKGEGQQQPKPSTSGNGSATAASRSAAVPPSLAQAASRLTSVGVPPLRVDKLSYTLAAHMLRTKPTFTEWVEKQNLNGAPLREALTEARALDLGVTDSGAAFLMTAPAEILVRRLLAIGLAHKMGSYKLATLLEELPGDDALAELPDDLLKVLGERLKLACKIEQLSAGK